MKFLPVLSLLLSLALHVLSQDQKSAKSSSCRISPRHSEGLSRSTGKVGIDTLSNVTSIEGDALVASKLDRRVDDWQPDQDAPARAGSKFHNAEIDPQCIILRTRNSNCSPLRCAQSKEIRCIKRSKNTCGDLGTLKENPECQGCQCRFATYTGPRFSGPQKRWKKAIPVAKKSIINFIERREWRQRRDRRIRLKLDDVHHVNRIGNNGVDEDAMELAEVDVGCVSVGKGLQTPDLPEEPVNSPREIDGKQVTSRHQRRKVYMLGKKRIFVPDNFTDLENRTTSKQRIDLSARAQVEEGCKMIRPSHSPFCELSACLANRYARCGKKGNDCHHYSSFFDARAEKVCAGCQCVVDRIRSKRQTTYQDDMPARGGSALHQGAIDKGCAIVRKTSDECIPLQCAAQKGVRCVKDAKNDGICSDGWSMGGHTPCNGCFCRSLPSQRSGGKQAMESKTRILQRDFVNGEHFEIEKEVDRGSSDLDRKEQSSTEQYSARNDTLVNVTHERQGKTSDDVEGLDALQAASIAKRSVSESKLPQVFQTERPISTAIAQQSESPNEISALSSRSLDNESGGEDSDGKNWRKLDVDKEITLQGPANPAHSTSNPKLGVDQAIMARGSENSSKQQPPTKIQMHHEANMSPRQIGTTTKLPKTFSVPQFKLQTTSSNLNRREIHPDCLLRSVRGETCAYAACARNPWVKCVPLPLSGCSDFDTLRLPETKEVCRNCECVCRPRRKLKAEERKHLIIDPPSRSKKHLHYHHPSGRQAAAKTSSSSSPSSSASAASDDNDNDYPCSVGNKLRGSPRRCNRGGCASHPLTKCARVYGPGRGRCSSFGTFGLPETAAVCAGCACYVQIGPKYRKWKEKKAHYLKVKQRWRDRMRGGEREGGLKGHVQVQEEEQEEQEGKSESEEEEEEDDIPARKKAITSLRGHEGKGPKSDNA